MLDAYLIHTLNHVVSAHIHGKVQMHIYTNFIWHLRILRFCIFRSYIFISICVSTYQQSIQYAV
jgi:hypothetical protein